MTAKRFTWNSKDVMIDDNVTGNQLEVIDITEIDVLLEVLNELHEENQRLRKIELVGEPLELFKQNKLVIRNNEKLREENKQLKRRLMIMEDKVRGLMK